MKVLGSMRALRLALSASLALALAATLAAQLAYAAELWREYSTKAGGFSVLFPGEPKIKFDPATLDGVASHEYLVQSGPIVYDVSYDQYSPGTLSARSKSHVLGLARDRLVAGQPVRLLADTLVQAGTEVGREVIFQEADGYTQTYRLYVMGDRLYQTIAGGPAGSELDPDVKRFEDSFRLLEPPPPAQPAKSEAPKTPAAATPVPTPPPAQAPAK